MRSGSSLVHDALGALAAHRGTVAETYERGVLVRTGDNAREIFILQQLRVLIADGDDSYRLSRPLSRFLDELTQKQRLFELLGNNIGALNDRVHQIRDEYVSAFLDGRAEDIDHAVAEFHDACAELSDAITSSITRLLLQAESNFAAVRTLSAKERQNKHYLAQADKMSQALGSLERMNMQEFLDAQPERFAALAVPYRRLVSDRLAEWNAELHRVTGILKAYLYKLRQIAPEVKRLRAFAQFLRQNPGYEPPELDQRRNLPSWLMKAAGVTTRAYPAIDNHAFRPEFAAIAAKLPAPKVVVSAPRDAGELTRRAAEQQRVKVTPPAHRLALQRLGREALSAAEPVSALTWKRENASDLEIADDVWLMLVLHSKEIDRLPFKKLAYGPIERRGTAAISRNLYISDVLLRGRRA